jgi:DNA-binding transcriptional LysR family regulator
MATLMGALGEAELDIAFVRLPCESSKAFNLRIIDQEPMVIALARSHPLSSHSELTLEQLTDVAPILFPREVAPGLYELVYNSYLRAGIDMQRLSVIANFVVVKHGGGRIRLCAGAAVDDLHHAAQRELSSADGDAAENRYRYRLATLRALAHGEAFLAMF